MLKIVKDPRIERIAAEARETPEYKAEMAKLRRAANTEPHDAADKLIDKPQNKEK